MDINLSAGKFVAIALSSSETGVTTYTTQGGTVTLADSTDLPGKGTYSAGNGTFSVRRKLEFNASGGYVLLGLPDGLSKYESFAEAQFNDDKVARLLIIGSPTNPIEIPTTGTLTYSALIAEQNNAKDQVAAQALTVDCATGAVSGTIPLVVKDGSGSVPFTITGTKDGSARISGTLKSQDGKITGTFIGRLYGQGAKEIALLVSFKLADGGFDAALLTGRLQ